MTKNMTINKDRSIVISGEKYTWYKQLSKVINDKKDKLSNKDRRIMEMYHLVDEDKKKTLKTIGKEIGVTKECVWQRQEKILKRWKKNKRLREFFDDLD